MAKQMPPQGGDLPTHARERLNIMRGDATHHSLFTSDLSVNEFLLVREAGFDPVGLVVGSSIYHIGYQRANWTQNQEMVVLTQAMYHARELAMTLLKSGSTAGLYASDTASYSEMNDLMGSRDRNRQRLLVARHSLIEQRFLLGIDEVLFFLFFQSAFFLRRTIRIDERIQSRVIRILDVLAARPVTPLTTDVPFRHRLVLHVVVHGMATVAERSCRALKIVRRVKCRPPIGAVGDKISPPDLVGDIPLGGEHEIVVADLLEVALLPAAAIDQRNIVLAEGQ